MSKNKFRQKRKPWFRFLKLLVRVRYRKPVFEYLGEKPHSGSLILSNHVGASAPLILECYSDFPIRMWGTYEMNSGLKAVYGYMTRVYYHQKRHWNLHLARLFCIIAAPFANLYYKGLNLISTYRDARFLKTVKESVKTIADDGTNIVIFPENSQNGYFDELEMFYSGFVVLAHTLFKKGIDVPIFVSYYRKKENKYIFDKPVLYSRLDAEFGDRNKIAKHLLDRCNALGNAETETPKQN